MKILTFDKASEEHFSVMYEGLCMSQKGFNPREVRTIVKLFDKLDSISKSSGEGSLRMLDYSTGNTSLLIELEAEEFELLKSANEVVPWNGAGARKAGKMLNWLDAAPEKSTLKLAD